MFTIYDFNLTDRNCFSYDTREGTWETGEHWKDASTFSDRAHFEAHGQPPLYTTAQPPSKIHKPKKLRVRRSFAGNTHLNKHAIRRRKSFDILTRTGIISHYDLSETGNKARALPYSASNCIDHDENEMTSIGVQVQINSGHNRSELRAREENIQTTLFVFDKKQAIKQIKSNSSLNTSYISNINDYKYSQYNSFVFHKRRKNNDWKNKMSVDSRSQNYYSLQKELHGNFLLQSPNDINKIAYADSFPAMHESEKLNSSNIFRKLDLNHNFNENNFSSKPSFENSWRTKVRSRHRTKKSVVGEVDKSEIINNLSIQNEEGYDRSLGTLKLNQIKTTDDGTFTCRVEYRRAPTSYSSVKLFVVRKYPIFKSQ